MLQTEMKRTHTVGHSKVYKFFRVTKRIAGVNVRMLE